MTRANQRERSEKLREQIIDTAMALALEEGFHAVTVRKISGRMGYSTGIIYYHFKDMQEIIDAVQDREGTALRDLIVSSLRPEASFAENLYAVFHAVTMLAYHNAERYNLVVLNRHGRRAKERPEMLGMLRQVVQKGMDSGELRPTDVDKTAFAVWSSFLGFNMVISQLTDLTLEEVEARFSIQYAMVLHGITAQQEKP